MMDILLLAFRFTFILKGVTSVLILKIKGISSYTLRTNTYFDWLVNIDNTVAL